MAQGKADEEKQAEMKPAEAVPAGGAVQPGVAAGAIQPEPSAKAAEEKDTEAVEAEEELTEAEPAVAASATTEEKKPDAKASEAAEPDAADDIKNKKPKLPEPAIDDTLKPSPKGDGEEDEKKKKDSEQSKLKPKSGKKEEEKEDKKEWQVEMMEKLFKTAREMMGTDKTEKAIYDAAKKLGNYAKDSISAGIDALPGKAIDTIESVGKTSSAAFASLQKTVAKAFVKSDNKAQESAEVGQDAQNSMHASAQPENAAGSAAEKIVDLAAKHAEKPAAEPVAAAAGKGAELTADSGSRAPTLGGGEDNND